MKTLSPFYFTSLTYKFFYSPVFRPCPRGGGRERAGCALSPSIPTPGTTRMRGKILYFNIQSSPPPGKTEIYVFPALRPIDGDVLKICLSLHPADNGKVLFFCLSRKRKVAGMSEFLVFPARSL